MPSVYTQSEEYKLFRSLVARRKVIVEQQSKKVWRYYDFGPKTEVPVILLHGASGTAEVFYKQILSLGPKGFRVISVQYPGYMNYTRWLRAFDRFIDMLSVDKVHLFGTALGGYLAQCYAQFRPNRVVSLILCNTFVDTKYYADSNPFVDIFQWTPEFLLKRMLLSNLPDYAVEKEIANSIDFMAEQLETVQREDLAARLTLNCTCGPFVPQDLSLDESNITIIDVLDDVLLPEKLREGVFKIYPQARQALLKTGGNFPYLSRADEINMHIEVHLRAFRGQTPNTETTTTTTKDKDVDEVTDNEKESGKGKEMSEWISADGKKDDINLTK